MRRFETICVSIERPYDEVYEFLATPENLFTWASVLGTRYHAVTPLEWVVEEPAHAASPITLRFTPRNPYGVLDITTLIAGKVVYETPARLLRQDHGAVIVLSLLQREADTDEAFQSELEWTKSDLLTVKTLLESA